MVKSLESQDKSSPAPDGGVVGAVSALIRAEHRHAAFLSQAMDLPSTDMLALYHLANEPLTARELGDRLGLTSGSVTTLIDRLVARKLARRQPNPNDRRSVLIEMTKTGHNMSWKLLQFFIGDVIEAAHELSPRDQEVVTRFLNRLTEAVDADTVRARQSSS